MPLAQLFEGPHGQRFFADYWLRLPIAVAGAARFAMPLGDRQAMRRLVERAPGEVLLAHRGGFRQAPPRGWSDVEQALADGCTAVLRHAERHDPALGALAAEFEERFAARIDIQAFATPGGAPGFGWHYDAEDVFILQTAGEKEYWLRKNTVHPWPTLDTMPQNLGYESELSPLSRCVLSAGDWLYVPHGYWHRTEARTDSCSLAIGVMSPTALDLLDFLRGELPSALPWRQRLAEDDTEAISYACRMLADDLQRRLADAKLVARFFESRRRSATPGPSHPASERRGETAP